MESTCSQCGEAFEARRRTARFCGATCRQRACRERHKPIIDLKGVRVVDGRLAVLDIIMKLKPGTRAASVVLRRLLARHLELEGQLVHLQPPGRRQSPTPTIHPDTLPAFVAALRA